MYVDDLLLSGPSESHSGLWKRLRTGPKSIQMDEPEPLSRFLGREHVVKKVNGKTSMVFDMYDYCIQCCKLFSDVTGTTTFRKASTPFCPDGSLLNSDDTVKGELSGVACSVLMKCLWLARLSRPGIQKPICDLASRVSCWSRNDDKRLLRLISYIHHTLTCSLLVSSQTNPRT